MYLNELRILNFKNLAEDSLVFSPKINCISGNNGEGKTNLLDAVWFLSMTKSFFHYPDSFSISHDAQECSLIGSYRMDDGTLNKIHITVGKTSSKNLLSDKSLKRNDKLCKRFSEHIGLIPIVMVSPSDTAIINSGGEERRRFINQLISQIDKEYLIEHQNYNKLLSQRNKILKGEDGEVSKELVESIDFYLCKSAEYIYKKREEICRLLNEQITAGYYRQLSGDEEVVKLRYASDLHKGGLKELLEKNFERDLLYKYTTAGIHRDDFLFEIGTKETELYPLKRCGSQGQQKCFLISLKLAQYSIMKELNGGVAPILLLDDIFDKLDMKRVEYLLSMVSEDGFGQIFITDSNKVRMAALVEKVGSSCKNFTVEDGIVKEND